MLSTCRYWSRSHGLRLLVDDKSILSKLVIRRLAASCFKTFILNSSFGEKIIPLLFFYSELGIDAPFPKPIRELQSSHRDTLVRISYFPKISYGPEDFADGTSGRYCESICYLTDLLQTSHTNHKCVTSSLKQVKNLLRTIYNMNDSVV